MRDVFFLSFFPSSDGARPSGLCLPILEACGVVLYGFCNSLKQNLTNIYLFIAHGRIFVEHHHMIHSEKHTC